jgi:prevent-host-death family protein
MILRKGGTNMPHIRPISDLRNKFTEISKIVHETEEPVFLTKNGHGDMVVMSIEAYEKKRFDSEIYQKLKEAEIEAKTTGKRYKHQEVINGLKTRVAENQEDYNV